MTTEKCTVTRQDAVNRSREARAMAREKERQDMTAKANAVRVLSRSMTERESLRSAIVQIRRILDDIEAALQQ